MLAVNLGRGVVTGLMVDGKLFHGAQGIAVEIGHMTIDIHGEICECGNRGCLQTFATVSAVTEYAKKVMEEELADSHLKMFELTAERVYASAVAGNRVYKEILHQTGVIIGTGLTNLIHMINSAKIVLGGGLMNSEEFILPAIK